MAAPNVVDVTSATFEQEVIARSREVPVLVDFWAPWCGPCRMLGPVLEKLAGEMAGRFVLAKLNTDENQDVAGRYQIRGIPDVRLFKDGQVVDGFVGAQPEHAVRAFLAPHCPSEAAEIIARGRAAAAADDAATARAAYEQALELEPSSAEARLELARLALGEGDIDAVAEQVAAIPASADEYEAAQNLARAAELAAEAAGVGDRGDVAARVEADPKDHEARFALAGHQLAAGDYESALASYLEIAKASPSWRDQAARKAMLVVFGILGVRHPTSDAFRAELQLIY